MKDFLSGYRLRKFLPIQHCLVPVSKSFSDDQKNESVDLINDFVSSKPKIIGLKITVFFVLIDIISILFNLKIFSQLSLSKQNKLMTFLFDNKIPILRKGFWGINTLAKLGVYSQPSMYEQIGYVGVSNE